MDLRFRLVVVSALYRFFIRLHYIIDGSLTYLTRKVLYTLLNIIVALHCVASHAVIACHLIDPTVLSIVIIKLFVKNSLTHYPFFYE